MKKKDAIKNFFHNRLYLSVIALCASLFMGIGAVFAWFLTGEDNRLGDLSNQVVSGSEITMDMTVDGTSGSLTFDNAAPGRTYVCVINLYNNTDVPALANLDFLEIKSEIYRDTDKKIVDETKSFLNVMGVQILSDSNPDFNETNFTCLAYRMKYDAFFSYPDRENVRLFSNYPVPVRQDGESVQAKITLQLRFLENFHNDENEIVEGVNINDYQAQQFIIKHIRVSAGKAA